MSVTFPQAIVSVVVIVPLHPLESVAVALTEKVPPTVGIPLRTPLVANIRPLGRVLVVEKVTGREAPLTVKLPLKDVPSAMFEAPLGGVKVIVGQSMTIVYWRLPVQVPGPVADNVKLKLPTPVGLPVIIPVELLSDRPLGSDPELTT